MSTCCKATTSNLPSPPSIAYLLTEVPERGAVRTRNGDLVVPDRGQRGADRVGCALRALDRDAAGIRGLGLAAGRTDPDLAGADPAGRRNPRGRLGAHAGPGGRGNAHAPRVRPSRAQLAARRAARVARGQGSRGGRYARDRKSVV